MTAAACPFCGGEEAVSLSEAWTDHRFVLETCCEGLHDELCLGMAEDPAWARALLASLGAEALLGRGRLRRVAGDGAAGLVLDWRLAVRPVPFARARRFVERHHEHCGPPPVIWTSQEPARRTAGGSCGTLPAKNAPSPTPHCAWSLPSRSWAT